MHCGEPEKVEPWSTVDREKIGSKKEWAEMLERRCRVLMLFSLCVHVCLKIVDSSIMISAVLTLTPSQLTEQRKGV